MFASKKSGVVFDGTAGRIYDLDIGDNPELEPREKYWRALGFLIAQADIDGMCAIRLGLKERRTFLQYYGPKTESVRRWWDMQPPESDWFPFLVKAIFEQIVLQPGPHLEGYLLAHINRRRLDVQVRFASLSDIELRWEETS